MSRIKHHPMRYWRGRDRVTTPRLFKTFRTRSTLRGIGIILRISIFTFPTFWTSTSRTVGTKTFYTKIRSFLRFTTFPFIFPCRCIHNCCTFKIPLSRGWGIKFWGRVQSFTGVCVFRHSEVNAVCWSTEWSFMRSLTCLHCGLVIESARWYMLKNSSDACYLLTNLIQIAINVIDRWYEN